MKNIPIKVLIVDDEIAVAIGLTRYLELNGMDTEFSTDAYDALEKVNNMHFDVIITDVLMPYLDGIEFVLRIKNIDEQKVIIGISGGGVIDSGVYLDTISAVGVYAVLQKPFKLKDMLTTIRRAMKVTYPSGSENLVEDWL